MPSCLCESTPQSEHPGPGVVSSEESLIRLVYYNEHINEDGSLKTAAITTKDITREVDGKVPSRGCSVNRRAFAEDSRLEEKALDQSARGKNSEDRKEVWAYELGTAQVRALADPEGNRAFCVVDRAEPDDASHAEIWGAHANRKTSVLRSIRSDLIDVMRRSFRVVG